MLTASRWEYQTAAEGGTTPEGMSALCFLYAAKVPNMRHVRHSHSRRSTTRQTFFYIAQFVQIQM